MDKIHPWILEPLTKERAQNILSLFSLGKDESMVFTEDGYDYMHTLTVGAEFRKLEKVVKDKIGRCKNEKELAAKLKSEWLNPYEVIRAVIKRDYPEDYMTFNEYKKWLDSK